MNTQVNRTALFLNVGLLLISLLSLISVYTPPYVFWPSSLLSLFLPIFIIFNLTLFIFYIFKKHILFTLHLFTLCLSFNLIQSIFTFKLTTNSPPLETVSVLSYNVGTIGIKNPYAGNIIDLKVHSIQHSDDLLNWIVEEDSGIKCFQEFFSNSSSIRYNTIKRFTDVGYEYALSSYNLPYNESSIGVCIFSKYPIINREQVVFDSLSINRGIIADVVIDRDTLRIINVHMRSFAFEQNKIESRSKSKQLAYLTHTFKTSIVARSLQFKVLLAHIQASPYPLILCGDFNIPPYSYSYQTIRRTLNNTFENEGSGFGFTYRSTLPIVRIDNQFYSKELIPVQFETLHVPYSDHFPIRGDYLLK